MKQTITDYLKQNNLNYKEYNDNVDLCKAYGRLSAKKQLSESQSRYLEKIDDVYIKEYKTLSKFFDKYVKTYGDLKEFCDVFFEEDVDWREYSIVSNKNDIKNSQRRSKLISERRRFDFISRSKLRKILTTQEIKSYKDKQSESSIALFVKHPYLLSLATINGTVPFSSSNFISLLNNDKNSFAKICLSSKLKITLNEESIIDVAGFSNALINNAVNKSIDLTQEETAQLVFVLQDMVWKSKTVLEKITVNKDNEMSF